MLSQNNNALGIIFPNSYDNTVPELVTERTMASIPFAGRYRMVDFVLSSMANCGISNVSVVVRKNYHSLMDHLGTGREWDMARRHGGLNIVPPFAEKGVRIYSGRVEALGSILSYLENQKEKYVVMSDANIAINYDFNALLAAHQASGADVTVAYQKTEIPEGRKNDNYTLTVPAAACPSCSPTAASRMAARITSAVPIIPSRSTAWPTCCPGRSSPPPRTPSSCP